MKNVVTMVALLVLVCSALSVAQTAGGWRVTVGAEGGLPISDFKTGSNFGVGGVGSVGYMVDPSFMVGVKSGYLSFSNATSGGPSVGAIPILVTGKYYFMPGDTKVYGDASVGMFSLSGGGTSVTKFGFAPALGAEFKAGDKMWVDVHGNYSMITDALGVGTTTTAASFIGFGIGLVFDLQ